MILLGGLLCSVGASAGALRIQAQNPGRMVPVGEFTLSLSNTGATPLREVRMHAPAAVQLRCATSTRNQQAFAPGGSLAAGDRVDCTVVLAAGAATSHGVEATGIDDQGRGHVAHTSINTRGATPSQGVVVLLAGAVHNDTDNDGRLDAGESIGYHYTLMNLGTLALSAVAVNDLSGVATCPQTTLAVSASMVCNRNYVITGTDQTNGFVGNDIRVTATDALGGPVAGGDVLTLLNLAGRAAIRVFKSPLLQNDADGSGFASVGDLIRYTFAVKNGNAETLSLVELIEPDPTLIDTPIACAANTLGGAPFSGNGSGALASGDTVLCNADYTIRSSDEDAGQALNLVEAYGTAPVAGRIVATGASAIVVPGGFVITVEKTSDLIAVFPGGLVIYRIVVTNPGTLPVANVIVSDPLPAGVQTFTWTCAGAACPNVSGSGAINEHILSLPAGAQVIYTVRATLAPEPPPTVVNIVTVITPVTVLCIPGNLPPPCASSAPVEVVPLPYGVPVGGRTAQWLLAGLLILAGFVALRRR
ncbi:MAG: DUF11 domain-containing protein [Xanthomonadales bacterium PRO6]|nr:DUF11 domain-containing protein [Xanthomonadales bacterium PRO6]